MTEEQQQRKGRGMAKRRITRGGAWTKHGRGKVEKVWNKKINQHE